MKATKAQIIAAAKAFCERNPENTISESDNGRIRLFEGSPKPGDIELWEENGELRCSNPDFGMVFSEYIHDLEKPQQPTQQPSPGTSLVTAEEQKKIAQIKEQKKTSDSVVQDWRDNQDRTYSVAGKSAPNAFAVVEEANRRLICTEVRDAGKNKDCAWGLVRAIDPATGQYREDKVTHDRDTYLCLKAWEDANAQSKYQKQGQPPLIVGVLENNMPQLNPEVKIKGKPAPLWLTMELMRAWSFADRDAVSKAERRAQLKLLNKEWREKGEIESEKEEERAVQEMKARA